MNSDDKVKYWVLDKDRNVRPTTVFEWADMMNTSASRQVAIHQWRAGETGHFVSTVFLGIDHSFGGTTPILWETMRFTQHDLDNHDHADYEEMARCGGTWEDAEDMHTRMLVLCEAPWWVIRCWKLRLWWTRQAKPFLLSVWRQ